MVLVQTLIKMLVTQREQNFNTGAWWSDDNQLPQPYIITLLMPKKIMSSSDIADWFADELFRVQ